jgi:radical SAM protein with 4Fe4S-binding SPASM domain
MNELSESGLRGIHLDYVLWEVTSRCNLSCLHCRADASPAISDEGNLTTNEGEKLIKQLAEGSVNTLVLTGGEPLLRPDIAHLVRYATESGLRVRIQSNGLLLDKPLALELKRSNLMSFGVGLDGDSPSIHDLIRRKTGAFDGAVRAINIAKDAGLECHVEFTLTRLNMDCVEKLLELLVKLKVDTFLGRSAIFAGRSTVSENLFRLNPQIYKTFLTKLARLSREITLPTINSQDPLYRLVCPEYARLCTLAQAENPNRRVLSGCSIGLNMAHIHSNGDVGFCTFLPQLTIGNVRQSHFFSIWMNRISQAKVFVSRQLKGNCGECVNRYFCGGCRARAKALKGDIFGEDPYCWIHKSTSKNI